MSVPSDRSKWTVEILSEFLEERQKFNEELIRSRYESDQIALRAALEANDKRLDSMNEFRAQMADQAARSITRSEFESQIAATRERLEEGLSPLNKAIAEQGKPNWVLLIGLLSVVLGVLSGCWLLIGLQINVSETPQVLALEQVKTAQAASLQAAAVVEQRLRTLEGSSNVGAAADAESRTDRSRLNARLATLESAFSGGVAERKAADARFGAALVEIETQFCAADALRSLMHATDLRYISMLWTVTHKGEHLPTDNAYYPQVCNREASIRERNSPP